MIKRHEKFKVPFAEHEPHRLVVSRMVTRRAGTSTIAEWRFTAASRSRSGLPHQIIRNAPLDMLGVPSGNAIQDRQRCCITSGSERDLIHTGSHADRDDGRCDVRHHAAGWSRQAKTESDAANARAELRSRQRGEAQPFMRSRM